MKIQELQSKSMKESMFIPGQNHKYSSKVAAFLADLTKVHPLVHRFIVLIQVLDKQSGDNTSSPMVPAVLPPSKESRVSGKHSSGVLP